MSAFFCLFLCFDHISTEKLEVYIPTFYKITYTLEELYVAVMWIISRLLYWPAEHRPSYFTVFKLCRHFRTHLLTYLEYFPISFPLFLSWWTLLILQKTVITYSLVWHANTDTILILEFLTWLLTSAIFNKVHVF